MIYCSWRLELAPRPIFTSLSPGAIFVDHDQADADGAGRCLVNMFLGKYLRWMLPRPLISTFITPINLVLDNKHFKVSSVATKSKYFFAVIQFSGKSQNETDYFCCSQSQLTLNFLCDFCFISQHFCLMVFEFPPFEVSPSLTREASQKIFLV